MMEFKNCKDIPALRLLWKEAFGDTDEFLDAFFNTAYSHTHCLTAFIDNELAGALYIIDCQLDTQKIAYIYAVCTAKKHRRKGVCKNLLSHTHKYLKDNGYTATILVPSGAELFTFYENSGYKTLGYIDEFKCEKSEDTLNLCEIGAEEYMDLRQNFLGYNPLTLKNLDFLKTQYSFFKGTDFILTARKHQDTLIATELLGNCDNADKIVSSLGCEKGVFRTMGTKKPFLMGISLYGTPFTENIYFPFAFD